MEVQIKTESWKIKDTETGKTIAGTFKITMGKTEIASKDFNDGYNGTKIKFPAELIAEIEAIDEKVRQAVVNNYTT